MRIAVIDSGVNLATAGGVSLTGGGNVDSIGHGTAVAATMLDKAPDARIYSVKVFDKELKTSRSVVRRRDSAAHRHSQSPSRHQPHAGPAAGTHARRTQRQRRAGRYAHRHEEEGINGTIYSPPIGDHGHGAGPLIGLWDRQEGVPSRGDVSLLPSTWFSIELSALTPISEWGGKELWIGQEEDAILDESGAMQRVLGRQTDFHLVR